MNAERFSAAMDELDGRYITEANRYRRPAGIKWGALAACLAAVLVGIRLLVPQSLPMLRIEEKSSGGMGFEGYIAHDVSELVSANPWREEMGLSALPVYRNPLSYDENGIAQKADFGKMRELLLETAERLGLAAEELTVRDNVPDEETQRKITEKFQSVGDTVPEGYFAPTELSVEADGVTVSVDQTMTAEISFEPAVPLPEGYTFTHYASYEELTAVAGYLQSAYEDLLHMEDPQVNIYGGDYNFYGQQGYSLEFFDGAGSDTQQILSYNLRRTAFYCNDEGELFIIRIYRPDLSEKSGDYPIISLEEASALLEEGHYITTVPYAMPGASCVKKAELIYRTEGQAYLMPYYRFYVELPEEERENGMKTYGAYYVPAVEERYIENMPVWDGGFN